MSVAEAGRTRRPEGQWACTPSASEGESCRFRARARAGGGRKGGRAAACAHARAGGARGWEGARGVGGCARGGGPTWGLGAGGGMGIERPATSVSGPEPIPRSGCGEGAV